MVKERRSAKRIKYDMVRVYSKMETHVDGKAKSVFKRKPYALCKIKNKEQVCRYLEIRQTCFFMQKIEMQYQICYTEQWYKRKYNKKRNANESE